MHYSRYESPVGPLIVAVSGQGLAVLEFERTYLKGKDRKGWVKSEEKTRPYVRQLEEYFGGKRREFTFPLDLRGTDFQKRCWQALLKIPYGQTRTYADQARAVGSPRGYRAVGMANHDNPVAIVVPCHRVIASDGGLGGYGGGLDIKLQLLRLEGALLL